MDFDGKNYQIFYYSHIYNDKQYWAFINEEDAKIFDAQFKLRLTNMIDEHGKNEADWTFILKPGEKILKCLNVVEPFDKVSASFSSSYIVK